MRNFFEQTLYWHQIRERNPEKLDEVIRVSQSALQWLESHQFVEKIGEKHFVTLKGKAVAQSGLLPETGLEFIDEIVARSTEVDSDFENFIPALLHWVTSSPEFCSERPARFLPYNTQIPSDGSIAFLQSHPNIKPVLPTESRSNRAAFALCQFCQGDAERIIRHHTGITSGQLHRLAGDAAWVLDGLRAIAHSPDLQTSQTFTNKLAMLSRQVRWGAPAEALDILRIAQRENVPGFGRQRATSLLKAGLTTFDGIIAYGKEGLARLIGGVARTEALLSAVVNDDDIPPEKLEETHLALARRLGLETIVADVYDKLGDDFEDAVLAFLQRLDGCHVQKFDDGKKQNVSDIFLSCGNRAAFIECKTTTRSVPLIRKEEAFSVLQKSADVEEKVRRICLGKPQFDESSKIKAQASREITLITSSALAEGVLRFLSNQVTLEELVEWMLRPGVTEVERLGGLPTPKILQIPH